MSQLARLQRAGSQEAGLSRHSLCREPVSMVVIVQPIGLPHEADWSQQKYFFAVSPMAHLCMV